MSENPLDRPVWHALNGALADATIVSGEAVRIDPAYGPFAAARDESPTAQAALAAVLSGSGDTVGIVERMPWPTPPGTVARDGGMLTQMILEGPVRGLEDCPAIALGDSDAAEMAALAHAAEPGPWAGLTHRYGGYFGVRIDGELAAMAGERFRLPGMCELSGVATSASFRGRGLAEVVCRRVCAAIQARGELPFLHCFADNAGAIRIYEKLGFRHRTQMRLTLLSPAAG